MRLARPSLRERDVDLFAQPAVLNRVLDEESNRLVARDYLGIDGGLFAVPEPQPPKWEPDNSRMWESMERFVELSANCKCDIRMAWTLRFVRRNFRRLLRAAKRG